MDKLFFIYTRFSVISKRLDFNRLYGGDKDFEAYKRTVLDAGRLEARLDIFSRYQLPLLQIASDKYNIYDYIMASIYLPDKYKYALEDLCKRFSFLHIEYFDENAEIDVEAKIKDVVADSDEIIVSASRLDDDDLLHPIFFDVVANYMKPEFAGFAVSLPMGVRGFYADGHYKLFTNFRYINIAIGLSYIGYIRAGKQLTTALIPLGAHTSIDQKFPTILDGRYKAICYTYNHYNSQCNVVLGMTDSEVMKKYFNKPVSYEEVDNYFLKIFSLNKVSYCPVLKKIIKVGHLKTCHGLYLGVKGTNLVQTQINEDTINVVLYYNNTVSFNIGQQYIKLDKNLDFTKEELVVYYNVEHLSDKISIHIFDKFLSANKDGTFTLQPHYKRWERFEIE